MIKYLFEADIFKVVKIKSLYMIMAAQSNIEEMAAFYQEVAIFSLNLYQDICEVGIN